MNLRTHILLLSMLAVVVAACANASGEDDGVLVVATTTILGDLAANVGGDSAVVEVLIPVGVDPHDFRPSSRQAARMSEADLVVANGLGLEEGLGDLLASLESDGRRVLYVGERLDSLLVINGTAPDPHFWMDPLRVVTVTELIAGALESVFPEGPWLDNAGRFGTELEAVDADIQAILNTVPEQRRTLVTNHDSLGYFAQRYAFTVIGVVVPGGSTLAEPSSSHLAELVRGIEQAEVSAVFVETTESTSLAEAIAAETQKNVEVVELYIGSLGGSGSGAETYIEMMRTNAALIAGALR